MLKLITKIFIVTMLSFILLNVLAYAVVSNRKISRLFGVEDIGTEVYEAIALSNDYFPDRNVVILGDSVARQLITTKISNRFNAINLTCNQAISLAGHYILLSNIINRNPQVSKVYLLYNVDSFDNDIDQEWTFNYFVKPFYYDYHNKFSVGTLNKVNSKFIWPLFMLPISKVLPCFGSIDYSVKNLSNKDCAVLSPTSLEYLKLIENLCRQRNISFKIIPTPISASINNKLQTNCLMKQIKDNELDDVFKNYLNKMIVFDDHNFKDNYHLKVEYKKSVSDYLIDNVGLLSEDRQ